MRDQRPYSVAAILSRFEIYEVVLRGGGDENRSATQAAAGRFPSGSGRMHNYDGGG